MNSAGRQSVQQHVLPQGASTADLSGLSDLWDLTASRLDQVIELSATLGEELPYIATWAA